MPMRALSSLQSKMIPRLFVMIENGTETFAVQHRLTTWTRRGRLDTIHKGEAGAISAKSRQ